MESREIGAERISFGEPRSSGLGAGWVRWRGVKKTFDIFPYRNILQVVPRASTTSDAFNAIAEASRRHILNYLAFRERAVGEIVGELGLGQPSVSKHLRVLREVGLVRVRREGRRMFYRANAEGIRPLHEWTSTFERFWRHQLQQVKVRAERESSEKNS